MDFRAFRLVRCWFWAALLLLFIGCGSRLQACATCFGESDSKMAEGMNMGIVALLVVVAGVLGGFLTAGIVLVRRARLSEAEEAERDGVVEKI
ncbi:MAG: hypothetical protein RI897_2431 [Verrucomicrobiota bacterium]